MSLGIFVCDPSVVHIFGLTGGIACGKSAVAARFRERGLPVIDADALAREVVAKGSDGLREIVAAFGQGVLLPDGTLDRKALAALAFADPVKRRALNDITHPRIGTLTLQRSLDLAKQGHALGCYEAALIVENGLADAFRPLVVVTAPVALQIARTVSRDGGTEADARARVDAQTPLERKVAVADFVIDNTGTLAELRDEADTVLEAVCERVGVDPGGYRRP